MGTSPSWGFAPPVTVDKAEYAGIVREAYAVVSGAGKAARVDTFNGNYGLLRGLAAAFLALIIIALLLGKGIYLVRALTILLTSERGGTPERISICCPS